MSLWFVEHRQQFIADHLRIYGQINRHDLMQRFKISMPQASQDLSRFGQDFPEAMIYDGKAKAYVVNPDALPPPQPAEIKVIKGFDE